MNLPLTDDELRSVTGGDPLADLEQRMRDMGIWHRHDSQRNILKIYGIAR